MNINKFLISTVAAVLFTTGTAHASIVTDKKIEKYLKKHPEVIMQILQENGDELIQILEKAYKDRIRLEKERRIEDQIVQPLTPKLDGMKFMGPDDAKFTIVEYTDFQCTFCKQGNKTIKELLKKYPNDVRVTIKHIGTGPISRMEASLFEAISDTISYEKAWEFKDKAFELREAIKGSNGEYLNNIMKDMGIDIEAVKKVAMTTEMQDRISDDIVESGSFQISGTPSFVINGVLAEGAIPLSKFEAIMNKWIEFHGEDPFCSECN